MEASQQIIPQDTLNQDTERLMEVGREGIDVVAFHTGEDMGEPLALSADARHRIYQIALYDLTRQLQTRRAQLRLA